MRRCEVDGSPNRSGPSDYVMPAGPCHHATSWSWPPCCHRPGLGRLVSVPRPSRDPPRRAPTNQPHLRRPVTQPCPSGQSALRQAPNPHPARSRLRPAVKWAQVSPGVPGQAAATVVVHVAGKVRRPGLVRAPDRLPRGRRTHPRRRPSSQASTSPPSTSPARSPTANRSSSANPSPPASHPPHQAPRPTRPQRPPPHPSTSTPPPSTNSTPSPASARSWPSESSTTAPRTAPSPPSTNSRRSPA